MTDIGKEYAAVGRFAREIVAKRVLLTQVVGQGIGLLVLAHVLNVQQSATVTNSVAAGISGVAALVGVLWSRDGTTTADPALGPKTVSGEPLVPASAMAVLASPIPGVADVPLGDPMYAPETAVSASAPQLAQVDAGTQPGAL